MRFILGDRELLTLRKVLISVVKKRYFGNLGLFLSLKDYEEWAFGVVDEGLAVALEAGDWKPELRRDDTPDALMGLQVWYVFMKCRPIADKQLRQEKRYKLALCATMVREQAPDYRSDENRVLDDLNLEKALAFLSPDQAAAISLLHFCHMSIEEAARIMRRSRSAMDMLLLRARKKLSEILENPFAFDGPAEAGTPPPKDKRGRPPREPILRAQDDFHQDRRRQNES